MNSDEDRDRARRIADIVKALDYELARIDDNDGKFTSSHRYSYHGATYQVTYKPFRKGRSEAYHDIDIHFDQATYGYRYKRTGKARLIVEGEYKVSRAIQLPQRKDGTHDYERAIRETCERVKETARVRDNREEARINENEHDAVLQRVLRKMRIKPSCIGTVGATPAGIRLRIDNLTEKQAVALLEAAKAAGVKL